MRKRLSKFMVPNHEIKYCSLNRRFSENMSIRYKPKDSLHYRPNFNPGKINKIFYHCSIEHLKISRIAKFGGEML